MQRIVHFPVHNPSLHSTPLLVIEKKNITGVHHICHKLAWFTVTAKQVDEWQTDTLIPGRLITQPHLHIRMWDLHMNNNVSELTMKYMHIDRQLPGRTGARPILPAGHAQSVRLAGPTIALCCSCLLIFLFVCASTLITCAIVTSCT